MSYCAKLFRLCANLFSTNYFSKLFANFFSNTSCVSLRQTLTHIPLIHYLICLFNTPIFYPYIYIPSLYFLSLFYFTFYPI